MTPDDPFSVINVGAGEGQGQGQGCDLASKAGRRLRRRLVGSKSKSVFLVHLRVPSEGEASARMEPPR